MADNSAIEWTDATWNPVTGCTKITRGCENCYAARFAERWRGVPGHPYEQGFDLRTWPSRLDRPERWRKPRMIFVNSMSDLFHKRVPRGFVDDVFDRMETTDRHVYQVLTKRSSRMRDYLRRRYPGCAAPGISGAACRSRTGRARPGSGICKRRRPRSVFSPSSRLSARWATSTWTAYRGSSWAARAGPTRGSCASNGCATYGTAARRRTCRSSSSSGAGGRPRPAGANSKASSITRCRVARGTRAAMPFEWHPDGRPPRIGPRNGRKSVSVRRGVYSCARSHGKHIFGCCSADLFLP